MPDVSWEDYDRLHGKHVLPTAPQPWEHEGHKPVQHRDRRPPWCNACGWTSPQPAVEAVQVKEKP